jgi:hypothetical protein
MIRLNAELEISLESWLIKVLLGLTLLTATLFSLSSADTDKVRSAAPLVGDVRVIDATTSSVTLESSVNPQTKATAWRFEVGPKPCSEVPNPCTPSKGGVVPAGTTAVKVEETIEGLIPGTTYHLRIFAKNPEGEDASTDRTGGPYALPPSFGACPNDAFRTDNPAKVLIEHSSENLPSCRAYEQASPVTKGAGDITGTVPYVRAAPQGGRITYLSASGAPGGKGSQELPSYLATRQGGAWTSKGLLPPAALGQNGNVVGWLPDFSTVYTEAGLVEEPFQTTFLEEATATGEIATIADYQPTVELEPRFAGATPDGRLVIFESRFAIEGVPGALEGKSNLYLFDHEAEALSLVGVDNEGEPPAAGAFAGSYDWIRGTSPETLTVGGSARSYYTQDQHAISQDGSAVYFTAAGTGQLFARLNPTEPQSATDLQGKCTEPELACTINVSASKRTIPDPAGTRPAAFMGASADGTKSFFTSSEMLTDDANTGPEQEAAAIQSSDLEGNNVDPDLVLTHASAVATDATHLYWVNLDLGTISRAKLDGSDADLAFITATDTPKGVFVLGDAIYWTNAANILEEEVEEKVITKVEEGTIGKAKLNGEGPATEVDQGFVEEAGNPHAVTANATHVYWTNDPIEKGGGPGFVGRAKASDGGEVNAKLVKTFLPVKGQAGIALDGEHVYWMTQNVPGDGGFSRISRAELDGNEYLITFIFLSKDKVGKEVEVLGDRIYWAMQGSELIGRAKLNGEEKPSEEEHEFIEEADHPIGLAVNASNIYWSSNGESSPNPGNDLYRYDTASSALTDLTPLAGGNGAEVRGVLGASEDGSRIYFAANGVLAAGASPGSCEGPPLGNAEGACNLYLWDEGTIEFIARLDVGGTELETDAANWAVSLGVFPAGEFQKTSRITPDGSALLFRSQRQLTGYPSEDVSQLYLYRAETEELICVSCNPTGLIPAGPVTGWPRFGGASTPVIIPPPPAATLTHNLSDDGDTVSFETTSALVGEDTNGKDAEGKVNCPGTGEALQAFPACLDVYEWQAAGTGSCDAARAGTHGGCLFLLSTGKGSEPAIIADASADAGDVFFLTRAKLVGQDQDTLFDMYTARVGGGLASQNQPPPNPCQSTDSCHGPASVPSLPPNPPQFLGPPNKTTKPRSCPKGKRKVKGRCVKAKKRQGKKHRKGKGQRANANRRASR